MHNQIGKLRSNYARLSVCRAVAVSVCLLAVSAASLAHHSSTTLYDRSDWIEVTGEVIEVHWANPHTRLKILVNRGESREEWLLEGADLVSMRRRGIPPDLVKVGDVIKAGGAPSSKGRNAVWTMNMLIPDGREILLYRVPPRWTENTIGVSDQTEIVKERRPDGSSDIYAIWVDEAGFIGDPDAGVWGGDIWLTPEARAFRDAYDQTKDNPFVGCTRGVPELMAGFGPLGFIDEGDRIVLKNEEFDQVRHILMGPDAEKNRPTDFGDTPRGFVGYSAGHWEDQNTLSVRTTGMNFPFYDQSGLLQNADAEIVERWTLVDDGNELHYELTINDPKTFTKPVVQNKHWRWTGTTKIEPFNCDASLGQLDKTG